MRKVLGCCVRTADVDKLVDLFAKLVREDHLGSAFAFSLTG